MNTKMPSNHERIQVWSTLTDYPIFYYDDQHDLHLCAWQGVIIPRSAMIMLIAYNWMHLYLNHTQRECVINDFSRMNACGLSNNKIDSTWITWLSKENLHSMVKALFWNYGLDQRQAQSNMSLTDLMQKYSVNAVIEWASVRNEKILSKIHETNV